MKLKIIFTALLLFTAVLAFTACGDGDDDGGGSELTVPDAPGAATVIAGNEHLSLSWTAANRATAYEVWYCTSNNSASAGRFGSDVTATNTDITGLTNGTAYYVWLKAKNSAGNSGFGAMASGTPDFTAGTKVSCTASNVQFKIVYLPGGITLPTGIDMDDSSAGTVDGAFWTGETEVTSSLFAAVLQWAFDHGKITETAGAHNEVSDVTVKYGGRELLDLDWGVSDVKISYNTTTNAFSVISGYENHPVVMISWYGAIMFCNWLTEMRDGNTANIVYTGIDTTLTDTEIIENAAKTGYRLLSSSEWDYAARYIGTTAPAAGSLATEYIAKSHNGGNANLTAGYYWTPSDYASGAIKDYSNETETRAVCWYSGDPGMGGADKVMQAAQKTANQLGLYDMSGNAREWCFSLSTEFPGLHIIRGGSYADNSSQIRLGILEGCPAESLYPMISFRIARTQ